MTGKMALVDCPCPSDFLRTYDSMKWRNTKLEQQDDLSQLFTSTILFFTNMDSIENKTYMIIESLKK